MQKIAVAAEVRRIEQDAVTHGRSLWQLMETAGTRAAERILQLYPKQAEYTLILCGKGNNGGDGYVAAGFLAAHGCRVDILQTDGPPVTELAQKAMQLACTQPSVQLIDRLPLQNVSYTLVIDAVYGIGFRGTLPATTAAIFQAVHKWAAVRVAFDLPSGTVCDTCEADPHTFRAAYTFSFICLKPLHIHAPSDAFCGCVEVIDLNIPEKVLTVGTDYACMLTEADIAHMLPIRTEESNKGTYGRALCVCGSYGMVGAAALAATGALRSGCGLVQLAVPDVIYPILATALWEPIFLPLPHQNGKLTAQSLGAILQAASQAKAVLFGCGVGTSDDLEALALALVRQIHVPLVLDADGINVISSHIDVLRECNAPLVLTPHPGEMARVIGKSITEIQANRVQIAVQFARQYNVVLVLKGHHTVIAAPNGRVCICPVGNNGMAKGGSGDLLAGILVSLLAQGTAPFEAACAAVYLHGLSGDLCAARNSVRSMQPSDIAVFLAEAFTQIEAKEGTT